MSGAYNRCPYCNSLRKRYMVLGDQKVCRECYEEFAIDTFIAQEMEALEWKVKQNDIM